jgi:RHS repeat-associated protein
LWKVNYDYGTTDNNGNVKSQQITVPSQFIAVQNYTYDSLNRLKQATETISGSQTWKQTFTFDRYGNRKFDASQTTTLGNCPANICNPDINSANNRVTTHSFDNAGNTTIDAEGRTFFYDAENKQKEVRNSSNQIIGQYLYDGDGKRVKKIAANDTTIFVYDAAGKLASEYLITASQSQAPTTSYLTNDTLGSPRVTTDASGNVVSRRDFLPFGEEIQSGTGGRTTAQGYFGVDSIRQKFTSYERDSETDLDFAQARMYGYSHGRFTSPDPSPESTDLRMPQSMNRYAYVMNNPLLYIDPTGLIWVQAAGCSGETCQPEWIPDEDWNNMSEDDRKPYEVVQNLTYNSVTGNQVILDPRGPNSDNPNGWTYGGPNTDSGAVPLAGTAIVVSQLDSPVPGPADIVGLIILGGAGIAALMHEGSHQLPLDPNIYNQNKDIENKVAGLIAAAEKELAKLATDPPGPGGPQNHHRKEIKAMLDKAKEKLKRHGGGAKKKLLEQIEKIEKAADKIMNGN